MEGHAGRGKELSLRFPALGKLEISNYFVKSWLSFPSCSWRILFVPMQENIMSMLWHYLYDNRNALSFQNYFV